MRLNQVCAKTGSVADNVDTANSVEIYISMLGQSHPIGEHCICDLTFLQSKTMVGLTSSEMGYQS